jgi:hypothetical protein
MFFYSSSTKQYDSHYTSCILSYITCTVRTATYDVSSIQYGLHATSEDGNFCTPPPSGIVGHCILYMYRTEMQEFSIGPSNGVCLTCLRSKYMSTARYVSQINPVSTLNCAVILIQTVLKENLQKLRHHQFAANKHQFADNHH